MACAGILGCSGYQRISREQLWLLYPGILIRISWITRGNSRHTQEVLDNQGSIVSRNNPVHLLAILDLYVC